MPPTPAGDTTPHPEPDEYILRSFHRRWDESEVDLLAFWRAQLAHRSLTLLTALIKADIQARFDRGLRPAAADYLALFPELVADRDRVVSLVYEEFCLLEERDEQPDVEQFCARYGAWSDSLRSQLDYHRNLSQVAGSPRSRVSYPGVGDRFGNYRLRKVLGQGGAAQVYLASDDLVGDREVVLKVSDSIGVEPAILARLKHKNIVPILTVAEQPESGLRGICMPYLPGETLESILQAVATAGPPRRAASIIDRVQAREVDEDVADDAWKDFPAAGTYTEAVAWLGLRVANALAYLHSRGIYHRDIKPANILITHQDGPLLFDFNLAHTPNAAVFAQAAAQGGTLPYMAPEQLRAFLNPKSWGEVGAKADIYAFGLLLREMVTCRRPELPSPGLPLDRAINELLDRRRVPVASCRATHPDVPPSLDAIILKCLAYEPAHRYGSARELSCDLRRFLRHQQPIFARSSSWIEWAVNWGYRGRKAIAAVALGLPLAVGVYALAAPKYDVQDRPGFREATVLLNSPDRDDWQRALDQFRELGRMYPESALPVVNQYLAAKKLRKKAHYQSILGEAITRADALEVLHERLEADPGDGAIQQALGKVYEQKQDFKRAEQHLGEAVRLSNRHYGVLADLAGVKWRQKDYPASARLYQASIAAAPPGVEPRWMLKARGNLAEALIAEVDRILDDPVTLSGPARGPAERWPGVAETLRELSVQLKSLEAESKPFVAKQPHGALDCSLKIRQAALAMAEGVHDQFGRQAKDPARFGKAATLLLEAQIMAPAASRSPDIGFVGQNQDFAAEVAKLRDRLQRRLKNCGIDPASLAPASVF